MLPLLIVRGPTTAGAAGPHYGGWSVRWRGQHTLVPGCTRRNGDSPVMTGCRKRPWPYRRLLHRTPEPV